jgi:hypothetical protein
METYDQELLDHLGGLARALLGGALVYLRMDSEPSRFAANLRALGHEFGDLGTVLVDRAAELETRPGEKVNAISAGPYPRVNVSS